MTAPERLTLSGFLAGLDDASAAEARAAAARIDELARTGNAMDGIERRFLPFVIAAGLAFLAGIVMLLLPGLAPRPITVVCLAVLPLLAGIYALRVIARTRADQAASALNARHFLPHGGIYFAAGRSPACVVRVPAQSGAVKAAGICRKDIWW